MGAKLRLATSSLPKRIADPAPPAPGVSQLKYPLALRTTPRGRPGPSLPNTEVPEDDIQDLLGADLARDLPQVPAGQPQLLGSQHQIQGLVAVVPAQRAKAAGEVEAVPCLREARGAGQRVATPGR